MSRMRVSMSESIPGCVFEHCGRVPESVYEPAELHSPLELAVYNNDVEAFTTLIQGGECVTVRMKVGEMSCIEYAAMMGRSEILKLLLNHSANANLLKQYFSLEDVVERAYLISKNKKLFFEQEALAEANRYEAALYTAIEYNQPACVEVMLHHLGNKQLGKYLFFTKDTNREKLSAEELAQIRGHIDCYNMLLRRSEITQ